MNVISKWVNERNVFIIVLIINIFLILTVRFYPSMDGASHLYNSNLVAHLVKGSSKVISNYFILNKMIIPNWISYIVLSFFNSFLPAWCAEKILIIAYLIGLSFSFRLLIKQLCPENIGLSIIIFPFVYSFLFGLGFYNYCISFIFLFLTLYYWLKYYSDSSLRKYLILFSLITLTFFSAILTFFFLGFLLGLFIIAFPLKDFFDRKGFYLIGKKIIRELFFLLIISLPALVFSVIFMKSTTYFPSGQQYSIGELVKWLNDVRCIITYNYTGEAKFTGKFLYILIAITSISLFLRFYKKGSVFSINKLRRSDVLLIPIIFTLCFLFIIPNGSYAGMMSDRFCLMFYILFITWVVSQAIPKKIISVIVFFIIIMHFSLMFIYRNSTIRNLNTNAESIYYSSKHIKENSIILPVNLSDNWLEPHFSNYLGVDKPIIILENYEASVGWFPVRWNTEQMPRIKLGKYDNINGINWISNINSTKEKQIDYVYLYGNINTINNNSWYELKTILDKDYQLVFSSNDNYIAIYKKV